MKPEKEPDEEDLLKIFTIHGENPNDDGRPHPPKKETVYKEKDGTDGKIYKR